MEHLDVLVIGAGLSGVGAGHYLQAKCPWASYAIFEARDAIGGTWDLFRYPGIRSDSDMFTLGYSFRPWDGEKTIADGESILQYIRDTAKDGGVDEHIRFNHRVVAVDWSSEDARWRVSARNTLTDEVVELTCSFVFSCTGYYRYDRGYTPDFEGVERFAGTVVHPQAWPADLDYAGKRVVVIGSGATAVTLVPSMAATAGHVTMLQRSPTYIAALPEKDPVAELLRRWLPARINGPVIKWFKALTTQGSYVLSKRRPELVKKLLRMQLERQLPEGYDIDTHFKPKYNPWDQRVCAVPDGDFFKAIRAGSVEVVTDHIDTFTEKGILLSSGRELEADIIVTATGLDLLFLGGMEVALDGRAVTLPDKMIYKGMMLQDVPNFAFAFGYTNASWTLKCDLTCDYVCRLLNRMRHDGLRQCTPTSRDASVSTETFVGLSAGYVQRAADRLPKQGTAYPWRVHMSYLKDYRALKLRGLDDAAMVFSNPEPESEPERAAAGIAG
ncbi:NAD(P)/FAD-dependent oxidoreductase [Acidiferrimicrobium sp. IK]|uniref:flavin-containing monooxygenase n=1 Tax=Acidiferrimicrobium sp. IK TaxID=2871700 RepID=UPI0021CB5016|nr:NAD(P)/FAD-dependent oxidoreductase [Acidiferrimicrobium sp. IK]MCU4183017.1 NAD(P)/FAD-dependent oxidoreductase [Acidiferrimicrobium sp. IK]